MSDQQHPPTPTPPAPRPSASGGPGRTLALVGVGTVVLLAVAGFAAYWFIFRDDSAKSVDTAEAEAAHEEALEEAGVVDEPASDEPESTPATTDASGTWNVDTTIGTFDEVCLTDVCNSTFVGFRINEELASIGAKTVVGRSPGVTGSMQIDGTTVTATDIVVDMTQLITDDGGRNNAIRRQAIETNDFPEASFVLTEPIELGEITPGEPVTVDAVGELTLHGVTRPETIPLTAELTGDVITVFGQLGPILLSDYDIAQPSAAAIVLSVEDNALMELQLFFSR